MMSRRNELGASRFRGSPNPAFFIAISGGTWALVSGCRRRGSPPNKCVPPAGAARR